MVQKCFNTSAIQILYTPVAINMLLYLYYIDKFIDIKLGINFQRQLCIANFRKRSIQNTFSVRTYTSILLQGLHTAYNKITQCCAVLNEHNDFIYNGETSSIPHQ